MINNLQLITQKHQKASKFDDSEPSIVNTYCAISVLKQISPKMEVNKELAINFVRQLIQEDGNIRSSISSNDADLRMVYSALSYLDMLEIHTSEFQQKIGKFILTCQNQDGAFGLKPCQESHCGATYCAVASLTILKLDIPYIKQCKMIGGIAGRVKKVPDSCYSFWNGWTLKLLGLDLLDKERLIEFLEQCQTNNGGFSKHPIKTPDPIHTLHSLLGILDNENYDYVHAIILN